MSSLKNVGLNIFRFYNSVGDIRGTVFDVSLYSLLGRYESRVVRAGYRRLSSRNAGSVSKYSKQFEEQVRRHKLNERLDALDLEIGEKETLTKEQIQRFETIHMQTTEIQLHAKRKCRKILKPDLDFSNKVNFWHERVNAGRALLNQKKGKVKHMGHCFCNAKSAGIQGSKDMNKFLI